MFRGLGVTVLAGSEVLSIALQRSISILATEAIMFYVNVSKRIILKAKGQKKLLELR
jgi:hypothetical protein